MHLKMRRPAPQNSRGESWDFEITIFRSSTELQDIQIALLQDIIEMIDDERDPDDTDAPCQVTLHVYACAYVCMYACMCACACVVCMYVRT